VADGNASSRPAKYAIVPDGRPLEFAPNKLTEIRFSEFGRVGREKASWNIPIIGRNLSKSKQIPCLLGFFGLSQSVFFRFDRKPAARDRADNLV
jgi:hypothetical protein